MKLLSLHLPTYIGAGRLQEKRRQDWFSIWLDNSWVIFEKFIVVMMRSSFSNSESWKSGWLRRKGPTRLPLPPPSSVLHAWRLLKNHLGPVSRNRSACYTLVTCGQLYKQRRVHAKTGVADALSFCCTHVRKKFVQVSTQISITSFQNVDHFEEKKVFLKNLIEKIKSDPYPIFSPTPGLHSSLLCFYISGAVYLCNFHIFNKFSLTACDGLH
jgi:hypothetical protein